MVSKLIVGAIVTAILFIIGIILLSIFEMFSENWFIGIGIIGAAIAIIVVVVYAKAKSA